jgi:hypothetical protein
MKPFIEQRMYTQTEQIAVVQPNETDNGIVLCVQEASGSVKETRLYLTFDEVDALSKLLQQMKEHLKDGK